MAAYEYTALDAGGREMRGVLEGDSARQVRQLLRDQSLLPVAVAEVSDREAPRALSFSFGNRIGTSDLALLTRQLATLVRSGTPLEEALLAVSQQSEKARVRSVVAGVRARVMEGRTLAEGFAAFPTVFPEIYRATVSAGEQSYTLSAVADLIDAGVRMVQPDIVKMGGITGMLRCAALAQAHGAEFVPHQTQPTIGHMASLHIAATQLHATKPCELNDPSPRMHAVFSNPPRPVEGLFRLPTAPGLGLDIDEPALAQRRVELPG